jgi:hypothetical protein
VPSKALAGTVAWTRVHVGVHHGSDVLAGGAGKNTVAVAAMNDLYIVDSKSTGDFINEGPGGGNDTVDASAVSSAISLLAEPGSGNRSGRIARVANWAWIKTKA